eukprot:459803_1
MTPYFYSQNNCCLPSMGNFLKAKTISMETQLTQFSNLVSATTELEMGGDRWYEFSNESKHIIQQGFTKYHEYKNVQNIKLLDIRWTSLEGVKWLIPIITNIPCYIISINITECGLCDVVIYP